MIAVQQHRIGAVMERRARCEREMAADMAAALRDAMARTGMSKSDVARAASCQFAWVWHILRLDENLTLKSIARLAVACGLEPRLRFKPEGDDDAADLEKSRLETERETARGRAQCLARTLKALGIPTATIYAVARGEVAPERVATTYLRGGDDETS